MSVLYTNISENAERVIDPISHQVIYSLLRKLNMQEYFKDNTYFYNDRSAASLYNRPLGDINLATYNRLDVTIDTHFNPDEGQLFDNMSMGINTPASGLTTHSSEGIREIFVDPAIGFSVRELNMPFTISFEIVMRFREYDGAAMALSNILNRSKKELINEVHDLVYSYPFDTTAWAVLTQVFNRRKTYKAAHPDDKLIDWLDSISKTEWGFDIRRPDLLETTAVRNDVEYTVTRQQMSCSAKLDCSSSKPEPIMQDKTPVGYNINCAYTIQFGRPHLLEFNVPPIVEQNPMPAALFQGSYETDDPRLYGIASIPDMTEMMWNTVNRGMVRACHVSMPEYDTWSVPYTGVLRGYKFIPALSCILAIEDPEVYTEVDLNELDEIKIAPFVLEILSSMSKDDLTQYEGLFNITIFADNLPLDPSFIKWDADKQIVSFLAKKSETVYRMVLSEATSLEFIDVKWRDTLIKYRQYTPAALMRTMGYLSQVGVISVLGDEDFTRFVSSLLYSGKLVTLNNAMIAKGCNKNIRLYTTKPKDYVKFICNTNYLDRRYTIFDLFIDTARELKYLTNADRFGRFINIDHAANYAFTEGGIPSGNYEPLRIFDTNIQRTE